MSVKNASFHSGNAPFSVGNVAFHTENVALSVANVAFHSGNASLSDGNGAFPVENVTLSVENAAFPAANASFPVVNAALPNPEANWSGLGLTGVRVHGHALGQLVQTGDNEYYFTVLCHAASAIPEKNAHGELKWVWYWIGTAHLSDKGTLVKDGQWQVYNSVDVLDGSIADKDADDDGFPDEGVVPLLCGAWPMESKRVQLQPPAVKELADFYY